MNELDLLQKLRDDVPAPDPAVLASNRKLLLSAALAETPGRARRLRPRLLVAAGVAAALAVGLVVADGVTHDGAAPAGADAEASKLLTSAADLAIKHPDQAIPPGQYRHVQVRTTSLDDVGDPDKPLRVFAQELREWWTPANAAPPWTAQFTGHLKVEFLRPADKTYARKHYPGLFKPVTGTFKSPCGMPSAVTYGGNPDQTIIAGSVGAGIPSAGCKGSWDEPTTEFLAGLPRDADALLKQLRALRDGPDDGAAFQRIAAVLITGMAPADLRAALYRAALKISGVHAVDGVVTLDGVTGRAVTRQADGSREDIIINPTTGQLIGLRSILTAPWQNLPTGTITHSVAVKSQITPTAPH